MLIFKCVYYVVSCPLFVYGFQFPYSVHVLLLYKLHTVTLSLIKIDMLFVPTKDNLIELL